MLSEISVSFARYDAAMYEVWTPESIAAQEESPAEKSAAASHSIAASANSDLRAMARRARNRTICPAAVTAFRVWAAVSPALFAAAYLRLIRFFCHHFALRHCLRSSGLSRRAVRHASSA